jgi:predicted TIM-barrel fold metal-dependent hydrolase
MTHTDSNALRVRFGEFELDETNALRKTGRPRLQKLPIARRVRDIVLGVTLLMTFAWPVDAEPAERTGPRADHHQHLLSPEMAQVAAQGDKALLDPVALPSEMAELIRRRAAAWSDPAALAQLYSDDVMLTQYADQTVLLLDGAITKGRKAVSDYVATQVVGSAYAIIPVAYSDNGAVRQIAAVFARMQPRGDSSDYRHLTGALFAIARGPSGQWLITSETLKFPGPPTYKPINSDALVKMLDAAGIERAVVLSVAYKFEAPSLKLPDAAVRLRAENDWTAREVSRHPTRLVAFCGVNPLTDTAVPEIGRCARDLGMKGVKLHLRNSAVDLGNPAHVARIGEVFAAADRFKLPMVVHIGTADPGNSVRNAGILLERILPRAPDVVVQIAHMAGSGPDYDDAAMEVFAKAFAAKDPRVRNLYFDVTTVADLPSQSEGIARRIREIGAERFLYGSDPPFGGRKTADEEWGTFRGTVPLTDAEFATIRDNVAPYF